MIRFYHFHEDAREHRTAGRAHRQTVYSLVFIALKFQSSELNEESN